MRKNPRILVCIFFAVLTIIGLWATADYGVPCDEPLEQIILRSNLLEYTLFFQGEDSAIARAYLDAGIQPISQSVERDHGESAYYPAAPLFLLTQSNRSLMTVLWHMYTWLWFMVGVYALYAIIRGLGLQRGTACLSSLFLYLSPRFFAEGHYNNKDVVLLALILWTFAAAIRLARKPNILNAMWFALVGAMATNLKIVGLFAWGLAGIATIASLGKQRALNLRNWLIGLSSFVSFLLFLFVLTPAMWRNPSEYLSYVISNAFHFSRWAGSVLFKGEIYKPWDRIPLPHSYLPTLVALTVPIFTLACAVIGQISALRRHLRSSVNWPYIAALTILWLIPVSFVVAFQPLMYNGWRHYYFIYASIAVFAALGMDAVWQLLKKTHAKRIVAVAGIVVIFAAQAISIALQHPYQYAYFNMLAGGNVEKQYELDYWDVSALSAMRKLCDIAKSRNADKPLLLGGRDSMGDSSIQKGYNALEEDRRAYISVTDDDNAPYLLFNTTFFEVYALDEPLGYHLLFALQSYGNTICSVYELD